MTNLITRFAKDEDGATAIEYGLIAALIAVAIIASVTALGSRVSETFTEVTECMDDGVKQVTQDDGNGGTETVNQNC